MAAAHPLRRPWRWWAVAAALVGLGAALLLLSTRDVSRSTALAGGTPVRVLEPVGAPIAPAVVLSHGFSGSAAMMDPLGSALARAGHLVVMPDLPGHGTNGAPLADDTLEPALEEAVAYAAERSGQPVAVVGHSMGAGAVTRWATEADPAERDPVATVAISLPSAQDLPADASRPRNLLLLWGSAEPPRFVGAAAEGLRVAYPEAVPGQTVGVFAEGTARRASSIAGAEHISVIYRAQTAREVAAWVTAPFAPAAGGAAAAGPPPAGDARFLGLLLVLVGGVVATRPLLARTAVSAGSPGADLTSAIAGAPAAPAAGPAPAAAPVPGSPTQQGKRPRGLATVAWFALAALVGGLAGMPLGGLGERVPVAVAGYLMAWFGAGAVVLGIVGARRRAAVGTLRGALMGTVAGVVVAACLAVPARLTWAAFALPGQRWLALVVLLVVLGAWCWGEARLLDGERGWRRAGLLAVSRVLVVAGLLGAVGLFGAPGFLTLTVPLMVPILAVLGVVAWWARDPLAAAAAQAIPLALTVATTFPLLG